MLETVHGCRCDSRFTNIHCNKIQDTECMPSFKTIGSIDMFIHREQKYPLLMDWHGHCCQYYRRKNMLYTKSHQFLWINQSSSTYMRVTFLTAILLCPWYVICKNIWASVLSIAVTRWWLFYLVQTFAVMTPPMGLVNQTDSFLSAKCTIIIREKLRLKQHKNVDSYVSGGVIVCAVIMTSSNESFSRVTGHLWGKFISDRWIPPTKGQ